MRLIYEKEKPLYILYPIKLKAEKNTTVEMTDKKLIKELKRLGFTEEKKARKEEF